MQLILSIFLSTVLDCLRKIDNSHKELSVFSLFTGSWNFFDRAKLQHQRFKRDSAKNLQIAKAERKQIQSVCDNQRKQSCDPGIPGRNHRVPRTETISRKTRGYKRCRGRLCWRVSLSVHTRAAARCLCQVRDMDGYWNHPTIWLHVRRKGRFSALTQLNRCKIISDQGRLQKIF